MSALPQQIPKSGAGSQQRNGKELVAERIKLPQRTAIMPDTGHSINCPAANKSSERPPIYIYIYE